MQRTRFNIFSLAAFGISLAFLLSVPFSPVLADPGSPTTPAPTATPTPAAPTAPTSGTPAPASSSAAGKEDCSFFSPGDCIIGSLWGVAKFLALVFLSIAAVFLGVAGLLLNWVIYITVFQFGNLIGNNAGMLAAWGVLRDLGNICLLFGFIFMGVSTILNLPGNEFTAKRALPALIIFAVLMNFSLFAAEAVIDTSNAVGTTLYKQAGLGGCPASSDIGSFVKCATDFGISGSVLQISGIAAILDKDAGKQIAGEDMGAVIEVLGLTVFAAATAFVFFAGVVLFITRVVVLAFLMATSPIGFAGMAVPPLHSLATRWWDSLLKQSFFAPIFILLMLVSIKFMEGITVALKATSGSSTTVTNLASAFDQSGASNVSMVVNFVLITGFMLAALQVARSMGAAGASFATRVAGGATFGVAAWGARRTAGRVSYRAAQAIRKNPVLRSTGFGRAAATFFDAGAKANFDIRGSGAGKALSGMVGDIGKPTKGGFADIVHNEEEKRKKYAASIKNNAAEEKRIKDFNERNNKITNDLLPELKRNNNAELAQLKGELAAQAAANEGALNPQRQEIANKRQQLEAARQAGDVARAQALELSLNNDLRALEDAKAQNEAALAPFKERVSQAETRHAAAVSQLEAEVASNKAEIKTIKEAPKRDYADSLHNPNPVMKTWNQVFGVGKHADHHAHDAIKADLDKDSNQKLLEALTKANENAAKADHGGGDHGGGGGDHGGGGAPARGGGGGNHGGGGGHAPH